MFRHFWNSLKIISASSLILSGSFFVQHDAARAGGFAQTCVNATLNDSFSMIKSGVYLRASCLNANGIYVNSQVKLGDYIANYGGNLVWARSGGFDGSCSFHQLFLPFPFYSALILSSKCENGSGGSKVVEFDLNERISNQNGVLAPDF